MQVGKRERRDRLGQHIEGRHSPGHEAVRAYGLPHVWMCDRVEGCPPSGQSGREGVGRGRARVRDVLGRMAPVQASGAHESPDRTSARWICRIATPAMCERKYAHSNKSRGSSTDPRRCICSCELCLGFRECLFPLPPTWVGDGRLWRWGTHSVPCLVLR
jgi:hypothetical protein